MTVQYAGKTALVTGASTGIGAEFARQLAARGASVVLVARSEDKLAALASEIEATQQVPVATIAVDLSTADAPAELTAALVERGTPVDILINNAGVGIYGDQARLDAAAVERMVQLNVGAVAGLTSRLLPAMVERGGGVVVNTASTASFQATPHMAAYGATKAFVLSYTQALWAENRRTGVRFLALCPGATETPFFDIPGGDALLTRRRTPAQVVATALRALDGTKPSVVDGWMNALMARVGPKISPERLLLAAAERVMRPRA